jgi:steroid delta-isomerase-like uncharacterized protein
MRPSHTARHAHSGWWPTVLSLALIASCRSSPAGRDAGPDPAASVVSANKALARVWFDEVVNRRDLDAIDEHYAADYVHHGAEGAEIRGIAAARAFAAALLAASADRVAVVEQQVAEGDLVVTRFVSRGTHTGTFRGVEATGEEWVTEGICISRIDEGKIAEDWEIVHVSGLGAGSTDASGESGEP